MIPQSPPQDRVWLATPPGELVLPRAADTSSSRLLEAFERRDDVARATATPVLTLMRAYPAYGRRGIAGQLVEQAREHARLILQMTRTGRAPSPQEFEFARQVGMLRAKAAPLAAVMQGYQVGCRFMCDWIASEAGSDAQDLRAALSLTASCFEYTRAVATAVAVGYLQQRESLSNPLSGTEMRGPQSVGSAGSRELSHVLLIPTMAGDTVSGSYLARLSPRERELLELVAQGLTNKEIAQRLRISVYTTKEYMSRILEKTSLPSRAAVAAVYAVARQRMQE